jgi:transposase
MKKYQILQQKQETITGKLIVGIDPSKRKHQAIIVDSLGIPIGNSFNFPVSYEGYHTILWEKIKKQIPQDNQRTIAFAIETSCNLWQTLAHYLHSLGYTVLLVNPFDTYRSRSLLNHDASKTDPKDALIVALNSIRGHFDMYKELSNQANSMHILSIAYDKLRKSLVQQKNRLRAVIERVFPEFMNVIEYDTKSALYLLKSYLAPQDFLTMDIRKEAKAIYKISSKLNSINILQQLKSNAKLSIGIIKPGEDFSAVRLAVNSWIILIETIIPQMDDIMNKLIHMAKQTPYFNILTSLKGVSDKSAALLIAEIQDFSLFSHYKQIEKLSGYNLKLSESGEYIGTRHISHIGNKRLSWILYRMTEEAVKYIPEARIKYLKRQILKRNHRKNVVACITILLKLITTIVKENRPYEYREETINIMKKLEDEYTIIKDRKKKSLS